MTKPNTTPSKEGDLFQQGRKLVEAVEAKYAINFANDLSHDPIKTATYLVLNEMGLSFGRIAKLTGKKLSTISRMVRRNADFATDLSGLKFNKLVDAYLDVVELAVDVTNWTR